jgi:lysophospholipase L1-like esterase
MRATAIGIVVLLFVFACVQASAQTTAPAASPGEERNPNLPTLWLIGDSTVRVGTRGQQGWGDPIRALFDTTRINVVNRAIGGRSSRTFRTDGRWDQILKESKAGDFVIMQFGHNDPSKLAGDNRERGTLRGVGDETEEVTLTLKNGQKEVVHTYGWYMKTYATEAKEKGMTPIICSYIPRCPRPGTATQPTKIEVPKERTSYQLWAKQSADATGATFIDLMSIILGKYAAMTPETIKEKYYTPADFTHTSPAGAEFNAQCVVEGLKATDCPLKTYLK